MTPALFDLPLRLRDAVAVAELLLDMPAVARPVTAEQRSRIAARAAGTVFEALTPRWKTLHRDPVHPSAYYLCVDGIEGQPLLLRCAPAKTPSSGLFPKAILIGRTFVRPLPGSRATAAEMVMSSIPFGPADEAAVLTFADQVALLRPANRPDVAELWAIIREGAK